MIYLLLNILNHAKLTPLLDAGSLWQDFKSLRIAIILHIFFSKNFYEFFLLYQCI